MRFDDCVTNEGYVALQAWLVGQLNPRAPHAADLFAQDRECLYDAFLSVLIGTGLGFIAYDDDRTHHGLYAFDFFVGDSKVPPRDKGVDGQRAPGMAGESATDAAGRAMCHAIVDTWLGDVGRHIPFVASVIASVATLELVADVRVDECVFELDLPPDYARSTANKPWEDGSLLIGALDLSLVSPGPLIHVEASPRYKGQTPRLRHWWLRSSASPRYKGQALSPSGFTEALASSVQMGLSVESSMASGTGVTAALRAPHGALRCSGGPPTQWLEPCPRAGTPGECRSERASYVCRRSIRPTRRWALRSPGLVHVPGTRPGHLCARRSRLRWLGKTTSLCGRGRRRAVSLVLGFARESGPRAPSFLS